MPQRLGGSLRLRVENRVPTSVLVILSLILLALMAAPTVHAQMLRGEMHSERQDGALVIANPSYDSDLTVAIWAENWSIFPPYEAHLYCSYSQDGGATWSPREIFLTHPRGIFASALPGGFVGYSADALMDEEGVVHLLLIFGIWGGQTLPGDTWSEVRYGKLDYMNGVFYDQHLLNEGPMDQDHPGYSRTAICMGREVPEGGGERFIHVLYGYDPTSDFDDAQMLYARSTDRGETWSEPVDINYHDGLDSPTPCDIEADGNGYVYAAYGPSWFSP